MRNSYKYKRNRRAGASIAEFAAAMVLIIPMIAAVALAIIETSEAFMIHGALHQSALTAARKLAIAYGQNRAGTIANPGAVFSTVRYLNIVNHNSQYAANFSIASVPPQVTVVCTYHSGQHGCPQFPHPDPLKLGNAFVLQSQATCRLE